MRIISEGKEWVQYCDRLSALPYRLRDGCVVPPAHSSRLVAHSSRLVAVSGGTIRGIRGGRMGNLKGDSMNDLIGPGDWAADGVDRTAWRWSEVTPKSHKDADVGSSIKHALGKFSLRDVRCSMHVVRQGAPSEDVEMQTIDYPGG